MYPFSTAQTIILQRQQAQNTAGNQTQIPVNRFMPDLVEFQFQQ